jgi:hypothetical protein
MARSQSSGAVAMASPVRDAVRPFRLHDTKVQRFFAHRYYVHKVHAMRSALWIAKWLEVGNTVEVIDVRTMKLHGAYTRRLQHIEFAGETLKQLPSAERVKRPVALNGGGE